MATRIAKPTRIYFTTFPRNIRTPQEAQILYSFFKEKGPLIEFKFARDLESKRLLRFGWVSYKDEKISEQLLADEIHTLPEPLDFDIKVQKSTETPGPYRMYIERFRGFYTQNDSDDTKEHDKHTQNVSEVSDDTKEHDKHTQNVSEVSEDSKEHDKHTQNVSEVSEDSKEHDKHTQNVSEVSEDSKEQDKESC
ncbi:730_t:CDS:2 [Cetraspora pellucida]|uniref:730_t:CDS:1 n=1 Tax=Cetraspora pellucida TaxID=1433469 RepID=A0A9N9IQR1_9GLOM|nr:730_t:CDS:2 [Cetraspora pellucida]